MSYFISDPSILVNNTQCIQFQSKEVYKRNLILTHVVLVDLIKMANTELQALICICMTSYTFASRCVGFYKGCCPGSSWNSTSQQCERCTPGYSGVNCSFPCPYPSYGVECQQSCNCIQDLCDVSTGCMNSNKGCMPGYSGVNCSLQCPYPSYGVNCQKICNCIQELCDVSKGCQQTTTGN
nr:protein draper-like [Crassostrea gigas]